MQLHTLIRKTPQRKSKRVGRGNASGKGKTSGRGTKGQKARSGHRIRPDVREKLKKLPKLRGYQQPSIETKPAVLNVSSLESFFSAGEAVNPQTLLDKGLVRARKGNLPAVKILGEGELTKKLVVTSCAVSASAKEKIEKAGGSIA